MKLTVNLEKMSDEHLEALHTLALKSPSFGYHTFMDVDGELLRRREAAEELAKRPKFRRFKVRVEFLKLVNALDKDAAAAKVRSEYENTGLYIMDMEATLYRELDDFEQEEEKSKD